MAAGSCSATDGDISQLESDEDHSQPGPSRKNRSLLERIKVLRCILLPTWEKHFPFVSPSTNLNYHFHCKACNKDVSVSHQGVLDIQRHAESKMHRLRVTSLRAQRTLGFRPVSDPVYASATAAEVRNTFMIAQHNASLCLSDHITPMQRKNFPDSEIAKHYHCARTKTACSLNYALAPHQKDDLVSSMKREPFSLSVDASTDSGLSKMNPLTVRIYDNSKKCVTQKFLDLCLTTGVNASKSSEIYAKIDEKIMENIIPWGNCTAFGVDNTNSNIGAKNSIKSRVTQVNPAIYLLDAPAI